MGAADDEHVMFAQRRPARFVAVLACVTAGCAAPNPAFTDAATAAGSADARVPPPRVATDASVPPVTDGRVSPASETAGVDGGDAAPAVACTAGCPPVVVATDVAECIHLGMPNLRACDSISPGALMIDLESTYTNDAPLGIVLRFVPGSELAGRTVTAVTLRLRTTTGPDGESESTGELWQVAPFVASDLDGVVPAKVGTTPLGADQGFVGPAEVVEWSLPTALVRAGTAMHLAILPTSTDRLYYDPGDAEAPRLIIESR